MTETTSTSTIQEEPSTREKFHIHRQGPTSLYPQVYALASSFSATCSSTPLKARRPIPGKSFSHFYIQGTLSEAGFSALLSQLDKLLGWTDVERDEDEEEREEASEP